VTTTADILAYSRLKVLDVNIASHSADIGRRLVMVLIFSYSVRFWSVFTVLVLNVVTVRHAKRL